MNIGTRLPPDAAAVVCSPVFEVPCWLAACCPAAGSTAAADADVAVPCVLAAVAVGVVPEAAPAGEPGGAAGGLTAAAAATAAGGG